MRYPCQVDECESGRTARFFVWNTAIKRREGTNMCEPCALGYEEYLKAVRAETGHDVRLQVFEIEGWNSGPALPQVNKQTVKQRGSGAWWLSWVIPIGIGVFLAYAQSKGW